ncbi:hypothetical protein [Profundibacterium mesophilum]|uniref:Response regulator receive protein n=1 Tax=Profundibacterium mesophilum KAUST100406-0324 TaxID=1037889 RepID=A0A921NXV7_9RHOB|nr:hypothetical protein [Profundibacterium mesophilum]KAF0675518.1 Response regulator receive protein [Profundibacterium mesophilum KAUST100406-0324]
MLVLLVESDANLSWLWSRQLERAGCRVLCAQDADGATACLREAEIGVVILSLALGEGDALAVADFAAYRRPEAKIIPITSRRFFSDGSVFGMIPNVAMSVNAHTAPEDLAAIVTHYGAAD